MTCSLASYHGTSRPSAFSRSLLDLKILQHFFASSTWMLVTHPPWTLIASLPTHLAGSLVLGEGGHRVCASQTTPGECETAMDLVITIAPAELLAPCSPEKLTQGIWDHVFKWWWMGSVLVPSQDFALAQWHFCLCSQNTHKKTGTREVKSPFLSWHLMTSRPSK